MKDRVSAVLITRNETDTIARCIESLGGLDQVVVHDTGSSDDTCDIARKLGADVSTTQLEPFHFAQARNQAIAKAKNNWILSIDADEILKEGSLGAIRSSVGRGRASAFVLTYLDQDPDRRTSMPGKKIRLFRRDKWGWKFRVHEMLVPTAHMEGANWLRDCTIEHFPQKDRKARRVQNLELLKLCVEESPDHVYAVRQLGFELNLAERWEESVPYLLQYIKTPMKDLLYDRCAALMTLGQSQARLGDREVACTSFWEAHQDAPDRREPLWWAALELIRMGQPHNAIWWLEKCLEIPAKDLPEFSLNSSPVHGTLVEETLTECRDMVHQAKEAYKAQQTAKGS